MAAAPARFDRRQDRDAVERMGVRLRQAQADAGDVVLLYADESEALIPVRISLDLVPTRLGLPLAAGASGSKLVRAGMTHPHLAHAWAQKGTELRVQVPGQSCKVALMGALDAGTGGLVFSTSPIKVSNDFIALLRWLDWRYGPKPGCAWLPGWWCWTTAPSRPARPVRRH